MSSQLQRKRDIYHRSIRKQYIQNYFSTQRNIIHSQNQISISENLKQQCFNTILDITKNLKVKNYQNTQKLIQKLFNQSTSQQLTNIINSFNFYLDLIYKITKNDDHQLEQIINNNQWQIIPKQFYSSYVYIIIKGFISLNYSMIKPKSLKIIIECIWNVFGNKNQVDMNYKQQQEQQGSLIQYIIINIRLTLKECFTECYELYKKLGLGSQICMLIAKMNYQTGFKIQLLKLIEVYTGVEIYNQNNKKQPIGAIFLSGPNINEKQNLFVYALSFISNKNQSVYIQSLKSLQNIISIYGHFSSTIRYNELKILCQLMLHPSRQISYQALQVVNDIIYYSVESADELIINGVLLNVLHQRLRIEQVTNDQYNPISIKHVGYILCNSLLTHLKVRKIVEIHPIWQLIYQSIYPGCKLLPLVVVFQYYFSQLDRQSTVKFFQSFADAVKCLNFQPNTEMTQKIKETIQYVYRRAQNFWERQFELIVNILERNHLNWIIQQLQYQ